ncbi:MAG: DUF512 domain-containing protein [Clostridia bacterium]|nr:DUF512 domain-containing protein [Clostridia bacterium]
MVIIQKVCPKTLAEAVGLKADDRLLSINGHPIRDVLDYRFYMTDRNIELVVCRDGIEHTIRFSKQENLFDIGLEFSSALMDKKHSCANKCVFCFIDQLPKGLRKSLYFKDDDDRLSFLHGNYVTLTNLHDEDIDRIIEMHLSPVNISVHTTNPELRVQMMKNKRAGEVLSYLRRLADAGISLCTQIVLCKGINDGNELDRTMHDLLSLYPALKSCSVVPVGLTKFRDSLYPLEPFTKEDCKAVLDEVNAFGNYCRKQYGTRLFYCSDEFYLKAGVPLPNDEFYEDYSQIENGVGMITSFETDFAFETEALQEEGFALKKPRSVSVITGVAAAGTIRKAAKELTDAFPLLKVAVYEIKNNFFGENVTVAGLITGQDVIEQLKGKDLGEELLYPAVMLKADEEIFLDDKTPADLEAALGVHLRTCPCTGDGFVRTVLGINE